MMKNLVQADETITMDELVETLSMEVFEEGTDLFKITQSYIGKGKCVHLVRLLDVDDEDEVIIFNDPDGIIKSNHLTLSGFLKSSLKRISRYLSVDTLKSCYKLQFETGFVMIEPLIS